MPSRYRGIPFAAVGLVLLANPLYLDSLVCHDCGGWGITPLYFGVATAVGVACTLSGLFTLLPREFRDQPVLVVSVTVAVVASPILYEAALQPHFAPGETRLFGFARRKLFLAAVAGAAFVAGIGAVRRNRSVIAGAVVLPLPFSLASDPRWPLGSAWDLFLVTLGVAGPGVPLAGALGFVTATLAGLSYGYPPDDRNRTRSTDTAPDLDSDG